MTDIKADVEYAYRETSRTLHASRVAIQEKLGGGRLRVKVLEPAAVADKPLRRGAIVEVTSRSLACEWQAWPELSAAEQEARDKEAAERREYWASLEQKNVADPARDLPDKYDHVYYSRVVETAEDLGDWPIPTPRHPWRADRQRLVNAALVALKGLPIDLARDLLAAAAPESDDSTPNPVFPETSVRTILGPLAPTLVDAMGWKYRGHLALQIPDDLLLSVNGFVDACSAMISEQGGHLGLPETPPLRATHFPGPGWLRISYGHSSGRRVHAPDCHVLKSHMTDPNDAPTWPAWRLNLPGTDLCGNCGGPWVAASPALLGLLAATTVWVHRARKEIEQWQLRTCLMLLADAAHARDIAIEPDRNWVHRVVSALIADQPGKQGWDAYEALKPWGGKYGTWDSARQIRALCLAHDRLTVLDNALPTTVRRDNERPAPVTELRGNSEQRRQALHSWYVSLTGACNEELPDVDFLLFTLPGAMKAW